MEANRALAWETEVQAFLAGESVHTEDLRSARSKNARMFLWGGVIFAAICSDEPNLVRVPEGLQDPEARTMREIVWYQSEHTGLAVEMDNETLSALASSVD